MKLITELIGKIRVMTALEKDESIVVLEEALRVLKEAIVKAEEALTQADGVIEGNIKDEYDKGIRKKCPYCGGKKGEYKIGYSRGPLGWPVGTGGGDIEEKYLDPCKKCKGKGYLKQEWV